MKWKRSVVKVLFVIFLLANNTIDVVAMNTGFAKELLPKKDTETFLENFNISLITVEPERKAIKCFDVGETGTIAIGCSDSEDKTVCIYANGCEFQYGYSFKSTGSFGIELDENNLIIYLVRSDIALSVNSTGNIESVMKIKNTIENNTYWNQDVFATKRKSGDDEYSLANDMGILNMFASSYSQLIVTNKNGKKNIIYDVNSAQCLRMIVIVVCVSIFVSIALSILIRQFVRERRNKKHHDNNRCNHRYFWR